jgi:HAD superfamily hydrolase (TIGR01458 family)
MNMPESRKAVLIDLAGVLYVGDSVVPGAVQAVARLRAAGLPLRFLTNTTRSPRQAMLARLASLGFDITEDEVLTAAMATKKLVAQRGLRAHYLIHPDIADEMGPSDAAANVVVLGDAGRYFTYEALNTAFRLLMNDTARPLPLLVMAKNRYFKDSDGLSLDMGAFVTALEFSAGVTAEVVGKPSAAYFQTALADLAVNASEAIMIGDDLFDDIEAAQKLGMRGILVRTGKFRAQDATNPQVTPSLIVDDLPDAVAAILGN